MPGKYSHRFCNSDVHVVKIKKELVSLRLMLSREKLSATVSKESALVGINAGFYKVQTLLPFLGFRSNEHFHPVVLGLPAILLEKGQAKIIKDFKGADNFFLQTGPLLVWNGKQMEDFFYFKENESLFDCYIEEEPSPRSVFAEDDLHYYFIAVDGRTEKSRGLFLKELSGFLLQLKVKAAINLDGGSSSTLMFKGELINYPCGNNEENVSPGEERKVSSVLLGF